MSVLKIWKATAFLALIIAVGCVKGKRESAAMTQGQQDWADQLIAGFYPPDENTLPDDVTSVETALMSIRQRCPTLEIIEHYEYRGFLFLPVRMTPDQKEHEDRNMLNVIMIELRSRRYQFSFVFKA